MGEGKDSTFPAIDSGSRWSRSTDIGYCRLVNRAIRTQGRGKMEILFDRRKGEWAVCRWQKSPVDLGGANAYKPSPHPYLLFGKAENGRPARPTSTQIEKALYDALSVTYQREKGTRAKFAYAAEEAEEKASAAEVRDTMDSMHDELASEIHSEREVFGPGTVPA